MTAAERARGWLTEIDRLDRATPPGDVPLAAWQRFLDSARAFADAGWLDRAAELGWDAYQLFGCDRTRPYARLDHCGLVWLIGGGRVVALTADAAVLATTGGAEHRMWAPIFDPDQVMLPWEGL